MIKTPRAYIGNLASSQTYACMHASNAAANHTHHPALAQHVIVRVAITKNVSSATAMGAQSHRNNELRTQRKEPALHASSALMNAWLDVHAHVHTHTRMHARTQHTIHDPCIRTNNTTHNAFSSVPVAYLRLSYMRVHHHSAIINNTMCTCEEEKNTQCMRARAAENLHAGYFCPVHCRHQV